MKGSVVRRAGFRNVVRSTNDVVRLAGFVDGESARVLREHVEKLRASVTSLEVRMTPRVVCSDLGSYFAIRHTDYCLLSPRSPSDPALLIGRLLVDGDAVEVDRFEGSARYRIGAHRRHPERDFLETVENVEAVHNATEDRELRG